MLLSDEHFSVDGTLIEAFASTKPKDEADCRRRAGATRSATSTARSAATRLTPRPDARLYRKGRGKEAKLWATF